MRKLTGKHDQALDDLRQDLADELAGGDDAWPDIVEYAMNQAWDRLLAAPPDDED